MPRYVWRDGTFRDVSTGEPMEVPERDGICTPMIQSDIPEYMSPVSGKMITSRSHRRDDLARHDCVPYEPTKNAPKGYKNPSFTKKRGLSLNEEARDLAASR